MSELELIDRCRVGDREAQHALYSATCDRIYRLLLRMTRCPEAASDLAQNTYLLAFTRIAQFKGESSISTWLYRIAVNEALQFLRRKEPLRISPDSVPEVPNNGRENDQAIASIDLADALHRLDPSERAILLLRYQEGLDYRAIGDVLNCPGGTVASRLNRARDRLREILGNGYGAPEEKPGAEHPTIRADFVQAAEVRSNVALPTESE